MYPSLPSWGRKCCRDIHFLRSSPRDRPIPFSPQLPLPPIDVVRGCLKALATRQAVHEFYRHPISSDSGDRYRWQKASTWWGRLHNPPTVSVSHPTRCGGFKKNNNKNKQTNMHQPTWGTSSIKQSNRNCDEVWGGVMNMVIASPNRCLPWGLPLRVLARTGGVALRLCLSTRAKHPCLLIGTSLHPSQTQWTCLWPLGS